MLNDFLAKLPTKVLVGLDITNERVILPTVVDGPKFYKEFSIEINSGVLTTEKAIYVSSITKVNKNITSRDMLNSVLNFN